MTGRLRVVAVGCAATIAGATLTIGDPRRGGFPRCPFHATTGWWCPGCGSQRALHQLFHGHLGSALGYNALAICALPLLVYAFAAWALDAFSARSLPTWQSSRLAPRAAPVLVIAFGVLRNLPLGRVLAP